MKRTMLSISILGFCADAMALQAGGLRYTIEVRKFENKAGWHAQWDLGDAWGAVLTDKLQQSGAFIPETGQMTRAQLLVKGAITQFDDGTSGGDAGKRIRRGGGKSTSLITLKKLTLSISGVVYVIDATTGQVVASKNFEVKISKRKLNVGNSGNGFSGDLGDFKRTPAGQVIGEACDEVVGFLSSQTATIPWSGTVIKGGSDKIMINRGSREGVTEGRIFRVGKMVAIRDPDTGELLDSDFIGTIQVTSVKEKLSYATLKSGNPPKKGDIIFP